jgi:hypothetical protein
MKLKNTVMALALILSLALPVCAVGAENVAVEVGTSDLGATVPLCTYWYAEEENQGITPVMAVTNNDFTPIVVSDVRLAGGEAVIPGIPCTLMQSGQADFTLTKNPDANAMPKRAAKYAVIFTISKLGG